MRRWLPMLGLAIAIGAGSVLRLMWPGDIEYKRDERWTFEQTQATCATREWPAAGLAASLGPDSPPMSAWVFIAPSCVLGITTPPGLSRLVQILSALALLVVAGFVVTSVDRREREFWFWGIALAALNPMAVHLQRKIWTPSILPVFAAVLLTVWWRRQRPVAAFLWGALAIVTAQIQASGFFLLAGFFLWAALIDRTRFAWRAALAGMGVGAIPMLPWLYRLLTHPLIIRPGHWEWWRPAELRFWRYWVSLPLGFGLWYPLGRHYVDFLASPIVGGHRTWLTLLAHLVLAGVAMAIALRVVRRHWPLKGQWRELLLGRESQTASTLAAGCWGFGVAITLSALPVSRHYLSIAFPLTFVWIAWVALRASPSASARRTDRALLLGLCAAQAVLTALFLSYIHVNNGAPDANYGVAYHAQ